MLQEQDDLEIDSRDLELLLAAASQENYEMNRHVAALLRSPVETAYLEQRRDSFSRCLASHTSTVDSNIALTQKVLQRAKRHTKRARRRLHLLSELRRDWATLLTLQRQQQRQEEEEEEEEGEEERQRQQKNSSNYGHLVPVAPSGRSVAAAVVHPRHSTRLKRAGRGAGAGAGAEGGVKRRTSRSEGLSSEAFVGGGGSSTLANIMDVEELVETKAKFLKKAATLFKDMARPDKKYVTDLTQSIEVRNVLCSHVCSSL